MQDFCLLLLNKNNIPGDNVMLNVTVCGLVIVFTVLIILVAVIGIFGAIMSKSSKSKNKENGKQDTAIINNEDEQTVAVITAAVYSYYENNKSAKPVIRSIKPSKQSSGRGVWQQAGMRQNMQPF